MQSTGNVKMHFVGRLEGNSKYTQNNYKKGWKGMPMNCHPEEELQYSTPLPLLKCSSHLFPYFHS
jgi:hypothetical protein